MTGAVIDWYDFFLYGIAAATIFGPQYFPSHDEFVGLLASMASFAVGFVFRPLGGAIFGHFGDRIGRRQMLFLTVLIMGLASAAIGALPTYAAMGIAAPICLVLLRAIQGVAVGGEWGGAALMAVESAPPGKKNFLASGVQVGSFIGLLLGTAVFSLMQALTTQAQFESWGWRIPFLISLVFAVAGLLIRTGVAESTEFAEAKEKREQTRAPLWVALKTSPLRILAVIGMRLVDQGCFYIAFTFSLVYVENYTDHPTSTVLAASMIALALASFLTPVYGKLADRVGVRWFYVSRPPLRRRGRGPVLPVPALGLPGADDTGLLRPDQPRPQHLHRGATDLVHRHVRHLRALQRRRIRLRPGRSAVGGFIPLVATALAGHDGDWLGVALLLAGLALAALVTGLFAYRWTSAASTDQRHEPV